MQRVHFAFEGRQHVFPVQRLFRRGGQPHGRQRRGKQVNRRDRHVTRRPALELRRPGDDERHADAAFVVLLLEASQRGVVCVHLRGAAVVGQEKQQRVIKDLLPLERPDDPPHPIVEMLDHCHQRVAGRVAGLVLDFVLRRLRGRVHGVVSHVAEKRPVFVALDEINGLVRDAVRQVAFVFEVLKTAIDRRVRVGQVEVIVRAAPHEAVKLVEAAVDRVVLWGKSQVPFPECAGDITGRLEELWKEHLFQVAARAAFTRGVDAKALLVAPRNEARAGRRADVARHVPLRADDALPGQGVDVRRAHFFGMMRVVAHVRVALIVGQHHDDVGPLLRPHRLRHLHRPRGHRPLHARCRQQNGCHTGHQESPHSWLLFQYFNFSFIGIHLWIISSCVHRRIQVIPRSP